MTEPTEPTPAPAPRSRGIRIGVALGVAVLIGAGAVVYGKGQAGKESDAACAASAATVARLRPLVQGEVAALNLAATPRPFENITFDTGDGTPKALADFRGRTVLLNLWATWCVPCRKEMPALDRLQGAAAGPAFQVVAVNTDTAKLDRPKQFFTDTGIRNLPFYADPTAKVFGVLRSTAGVLGLPTTFLIDRNGCTLGTMAGPADWSSDDARRLIAAATS